MAREKALGLNIPALDLVIMVCEGSKGGCEGTG